MQERQDFDYPNPQMSLVLKHFYEEHPEVVDRAGQEFFDYVQAIQERITQERIEALFNEWFVYDFLMKTHKTPLETYVYRNPDDLDDRELDLMKQAADSSYTDHFWVGTVDPEAHSIELREIGTDKAFVVHDMTASQSVETNAGIVAVRLIQLDGNWYFASDPAYFMPMPHRSEYGIGQEFIDVVKLHYGMWAPPSEQPQQPQQAT